MPFICSQKESGMRQAGGWLALVCGAFALAGGERGGARHGLFFQRFEAFEPLGRGQAPALAYFFGACGQRFARGAGGGVFGQYHGVAFAGGFEGPEGACAEGFAHACQAACVAAGAAKQVHAHDAVGGEQAAAVGVEGGAVQHGGGGFVVIQIDLQRVHGAQPFFAADFFCGVGQHDAQGGAVLRQAKPVAAYGQHLRVEFDGRGAHADLFAAELGECACAQAQLHGVALHGVVQVGGEQHPAHHALHVFQLQRVGLAQVHAALNPGGAQVQVAHGAVFRDADFGQVFWLAVCRVAVGVHAGASGWVFCVALSAARRWGVPTSAHSPV